jgi:AcrR family transcriptional regulator
VAKDVNGTRELILEAARVGLLREGFSGLSSRKVAEVAGVPLSQLHYHFGGMQPLILSVLERENERLLERQARLYGQDRPLSQRYDQACDFLEEDIASGYVRVLQEMIAAGWANEEIAVEVRRLLRGWFDLLAAVVGEAEERFGQIGPFSAREISALVGVAFMGGESLLLLGLDGEEVPIRSALRRIGSLIRDMEEGDGS